MFVVNTVAGPEKVAALAALARERTSWSPWTTTNSAEIAAAAQAAGSIIGVMVELDTGMDRAGVDLTDQAWKLAERIVELEGVRLLGVTGTRDRPLTPERSLRHQRQQAAMRSSRLPTPCSPPDFPAPSSLRWYRHLGLDSCVPARDREPRRGRTS